MDFTLDIYGAGELILTVPPRVARDLGIRTERVQIRDYVNYPSFIGYQNVAQVPNATHACIASQLRTAEVMRIQRFAGGDGQKVIYRKGGHQYTFYFEAAGPTAILLRVGVPWERHNLIPNKVKSDRKELASLYKKEFLDDIIAAVKTCSTEGNLAEEVEAKRGVPPGAISSFLRNTDGRALERRRAKMDMILTKHDREEEERQSAEAVAAMKAGRRRKSRRAKKTRGTRRR